jgi:rhodanese-related sulfurtransferase
LAIAATTPNPAGVPADTGTSSHHGSSRRPAPGVSSERQQAIREVLGRLVPDTGRLTPGQLKSVATELAARRDLWTDLVVRDPGVRWYLPLHRSRSSDVWLLAWERGQDTDWHDHGGSAGSFAVADGRLLENYRTPSGRLSHRRLGRSQAVAFGPGHVHNVSHSGDGSATSIHAYSPPLVAMTYYSRASSGLIARETVAGIDGPAGDRGPGTGSLRAGASGVDELLARARSGLRRLPPEAALAALADGAALIDIRPLEQRIVEGEVPGAVIISRNVLEWRLDPRNEASIPALARPDVTIIVMCSQGFASSLAAASLRRIGLAATDLDGGFQAWQATGLPTRPASSLG